jgi:hypothetical protein
MLKVKLIAFLILLACACKASSTFSAHCRNALYHTLYLNFPLANYELEIELKSNPDNIYIPYIKNYIDFLQIVLNETPEIIANYSRNFQERYAIIEKSQATIALKGLLLAELNMQSSVIYVKMNERVNGFRYLRNAEKLIVRNPDYNSQSSTLNKVKTVALLVNTYLPPVLKNMVSLPENGNDAFFILKQYGKNIEKDSVLLLEYHILSSFLRLQFGRNTQDGLEEMVPEIISSNYNPLLCWAYTLLAIRSGKSNMAISVLKEALERTDGRQFPFLYFLLGELKTYNQFNGIEEFHMFLKNYKGKNHVKTAWQKLSWNYLIMGDTLKYYDCKVKAITYGVSWNDSDAEARREAGETRPPNIYLLRARLLFDGGMYNKARSELVQKPVLQSLSTERDRLEYIYRFARINHATGDTASAKNYYRQIVNLGGNKPYYFAANSALQLGLIAESENALPDAEKYFKLCLELNKYGYTSGIQAKVKAGLKRIRSK